MENEFLLKLIQNAKVAGQTGGTRLIDIAMGLVPEPHYDAYNDKPSAWITLEEGQHVPLDENGIALGGAGGWAKGKDFSHAMTSEKKREWEKQGWSPENSRERLEADRQASRKEAGALYDEFELRKFKYEMLKRSVKSEREDVERRKQLLADVEKDPSICKQFGYSRPEDFKRVLLEDLKFYEEERKKHEAGLPVAEREYNDIRERYWREQIKRNAATRELFKSAEDCKTAKDVQDYLRAKEFFGKSEDDPQERDGRVYFEEGEIDDPAAVEMAKNVDKFIEEFPFMRDRLDGMECSRHTQQRIGTYAYVDSDGTKFKMCPDFWRLEEKIARAWEEDVKEKFHPPGVSYAAIPLHEYTHAMEHVVNRRLGGDKRASDIVMERVCRRLNGGKYSDNDQIPVWMAVSKYCYEQNPGVGLMYGRDGKPYGYNEVKEYGRNTEWLAESMSEALGSKTPRKIARMCKEEFDKLVKEVGLA